MFKCELLIREKRYDVTDDLKNWDDFELSQKRSNYDGVVRSYSTSFEFVNNAFILLKKEYRSRYMEASASVIFSLRNNNWEYDEVFRCALDFSTYSEDGYVVSINAIDNTLAAIIKAKKSIQYEYPISDIQIRKLNYDGLKFQYEGKYTLGARSFEDGTQFISIYTLNTNVSSSMPLYKMSNSELPSLNSPLLFDDSPMADGATLNNAKPFLNALSDIHIDLKFRTDLYATVYSGWIEVIRLTFGIRGTDGTIVKEVTYEGNQGYQYIDETIPIDLQGGQSVCFVMMVKFRDNSELTNRADIVFPKFSININFKSRINILNIDVISPTTVLNSLLKSMTDGSDEYKGYFNYGMPDGSRNLKLERTYIMAAESARGLPKAKIYTSYKKFCDWMEAEFGYVPVISGNEVTFTHRDNLFANTVVNELGMEINDYELAVNDSLIYSSVKVGYDKQDYDSVNGRDEFRFTNEFSTGLKLTDNTLSLISPYRADAYGIEFLVQKRGEDTTDNDSDNDVFFVECDNSVPVDQPLLLYRPYSADQLSGLLSPDTMFNLNYSPRFMLEANKEYIGACTGMLKFASSNGNSDVSIDGVRETDDLLIPERLFTVGEVNIKTSDIDVPSDLTGLVRFTNQGEAITGYIKNLSLNIAKEKGSTYTLIVRDIKS